MTTGGTASPQGTPSSSGQHITTISHDGRFWDVYLDFEDDPRRPDTHRGFLRFSAADASDTEKPLRTATIIIEKSYEDAVRRARGFEDRQLQGFLRSVAP